MGYKTKDFVKRRSIGNGGLQVQYGLRRSPAVGLNMLNEMALSQERGSLQ